MAKSAAGVGRNVARPAVAGDRDRAIRLLKDAHDAARFPWPFLSAYADGLFQTHVSNDRCLALALDVGGVVQGLLLASWFEHPFGAGRMAKETVWWIDPDHRGRGGITMLDAYEDWARRQDCTFAGMAMLASNDVSHLYLRRGYQPAETHYLKAL